MIERGIPMTAESVRAILAETKTQTRRVIKPQPTQKTSGIPGVQPGEWLWHYHANGGTIMADPARSDTMPARCPYGAPGDRLWCREAFHFTNSFDDRPPRDVPHAVRVWYAADEPFVVDSSGRDILGKRRPGMFMPRWASRITLEVTGVRVERLQDISEEDARAEGVLPLYGEPGADVNCRHTFSLLWDDINGKRAPWASNPWVWVVEFKRAEAAREAA